MNAKTNEAKAPQTIEAQIAALMALQARRDTVIALVGPELEAIRELDKSALDSKNAADQGKGFQGNIWNNVLSCVFKVYDATKDDPTSRHQVFTDVFDEFLNPKAASPTDKVKLTTAGQYASTGRKMLVTLLTDKAQDPADYTAATVRDVRDAFKDAGAKARAALLADPGKQLRYAAKHASEKEWELFAPVLASILALYNPVKARKDKASKKAEAAREVPELQQQAPTEPAKAETVAAIIADEIVSEMESNESDTLKTQAV